MYSVGLYMLVYVHLYVYGDHILLSSAFLNYPYLIIETGSLTEFGVHQFC